MMNKVLIIEDDKVKIERLTSYFSNEELTVKESFQGGVSELKSNLKNYDFLILDMTIPLWEKGNNDLGGNYEQFGGEKILREMKRRKLFLPTILFTMFDVFPTKEGNITFNEINIIFKEEFSDFYFGAVFYNANEDNWQIDMSNLIAKIKS
ncbi:hypothetical protein ACHRVZ_13170 [Flavobacterium sp. FlaQc-57]|uniref:hypothetical protein n=1 Tax=Flavobacterium sp. FlaQc-57 TaxID=3374186 RepID=UPI003757E7E6